MTLQISKAPKVFIMFYMILVYFIYVFSALNWPKDNLLLLTVFYCVVLIFIVVGYDHGYSLKIRKKPVIFLKKAHINILLILSVINLYPVLMIIFAEEHLSVNVILAKIALAMQGLGDAYYERGMNILEVSIFSNKWLLFNFLYTPFATFITYNCLRYFKSLNFFQKLMTITIVVVEVGGYVAVGTNKMVFDYLLIIVACMLLNNTSRRKSVKPVSVIASPEGIKPKPKKAGNKLKIAFFSKRTFVIALVIVGALVFFGSTYSSRMEGQKNSTHMAYNQISGTKINQKQLSLLPKAIQEPVLGFESYLTQGLAHLDKALGMDFKWCYGLGASTYFTMFMGHFGISDKVIKNRTYEERMSNDEGVTNGQYWYSFYVAYANDITFFLVPLLIYLLAVMWGHYYKECLMTDDLLSFPIFILLLICFFYLNANNQIFGKAQLISFIPLFILSLFVRVKCKALTR